MQHNNEIMNWRTGGLIIIFFLIMFAFIFVPIFLKHNDAYFIFQCSFYVLILLVVYSIKSSTLLFSLEVATLIPFFIFDGISLYYQSIPYMLISYAIISVFLIIIFFDIIKGIIKSPIVNTNLLFGALIVYFLVGIFWSKIYFIQNAIFLGSFIDNQHVVNFNSITFENAYNLQFNFIYYSFCVLTTVGLGDIVPIYNEAKALTFLEGMLGQVFLGTVIAKLVATWSRTIMDFEEKKIVQEVRRLSEDK